MGIGFNNWGCSLEGNEDNEWTTLNMFIVDHDFLKYFFHADGLGRFFSRDFPTDSSGIVINQAAAKLFESSETMGKKIAFGEK